MALTPVYTSTSYCTPVRLLYYHDWQQIADLLRDGDGPRPSRMAILDSTSTVGQNLIAMLLATCGEVESACMVGNRYVPTDLQTFSTGTSAQGKLEKLVADMCYWNLMKRRQPASADPRNCPGALQAFQDLEKLETGQQIFGFVEAGTAGLPAVQTAPRPSQVPNSVTNRARRFLGHHHGNG